MNLMNSHVICIAHRGGGSGVHENKIETIKRSLSDDVIDAIEVDVRKTKDNILVLSHDRGVKTHGHTVWIDNVTFSDIKHLGVVSLAEVLPFFKASKKILDIDIKDKRCVSEIIRLFKKHRYFKRVYFSSYDLKAFGFKVFVWGTDKERDIKKLTSIPIDGIKTKNTTLFKKIL